MRILSSGMRFVYVGLLLVFKKAFHKPKSLNNENNY